MKPCTNTTYESPKQNVTTLLSLNPIATITSQHNPDFSDHDLLQDLHAFSGVKLLQKTTLLRNLGAKNGKQSEWCMNNIMAHVPMITPLLPRWELMMLLPTMLMNMPFHKFTSSPTLPLSMSLLFPEGKLESDVALYASIHAMPGPAVESWLVSWALLTLS